jgi:hypothetical protein
VNPFRRGTQYVVIVLPALSVHDRPEVYRVSKDGRLQSADRDREASREIAKTYKLIESRSNRKGQSLPIGQGKEKPAQWWSNWSWIVVQLNVKQVDARDKVLLLRFRPAELDSDVDALSRTVMQFARQKEITIELDYLETTFSQIRGRLHERNG